MKKNETEIILTDAMANVKVRARTITNTHTHETNERTTKRVLALQFDCRCGFLWLQGNAVERIAFSYAIIGHFRLVEQQPSW